MRRKSLERNVKGKVTLQAPRYEEKGASRGDVGGYPGGGVSLHRLPE